MDEAAAEEIAAELEALSFTYPELRTADGRGGGGGNDCDPALPPPPDVADAVAGGLCIDLAPRGARQAFVSARLWLGLPPGYPHAPAAVALREARGIGDARAAALLRALGAEAAALVGQPALGRLIELCEELLNAANAPEGPCVICLSEMATSTAEAPLAEVQQQQQQQEEGEERPEGRPSGERRRRAAPAPALARLPCYHAFHTACFERWWAHEQRSCAEQQAELEARTGATAAAGLARKILPARRADGSFRLGCPVCRAPFEPAELDAALRPRLAPAARRGAGGAGQAPCDGGGGGGGGGGKLSSEQLRPFKELQARHSKLFEAQRRRGGIIVETNLSITAYDAAAAAAAAAAEAEAAAAAAEAAASKQGPRGGRGGGDRRGRGRGGGGGGGGGGRGRAGRGGERPESGRSGVAAAGAAAAAPECNSGPSLLPPPATAGAAQTRDSSGGGAGGGGGPFGGRGGPGNGRSGGRGRSFGGPGRAPAAASAPAPALVPAAAAASGPLKAGSAAAGRPGAGPGGRAEGGRGPRGGGRAPGRGGRGDGDGRGRAGARGPAAAPPAAVNGAAN
ncbi:hypothetical protein Rsub_03271 [Raphidocelis subcapitata]|uniref:RWD domain-containing protein n=1 Tax=Raphidocelis subcapitata TaxID=307507 RepID=A0A2V0NR41_9CHLO|nr:hypothetical protein Rsub_03271 [Raphidocelis subcapitata]|eukprot:GBF90138.1 hypothetical protein Rsub_03271 [Raphidocelis subcapitata]